MSDRPRVLKGPSLSARTVLPLDPVQPEIGVGQGRSVPAGNARLDPIHHRIIRAREANISVHPASFDYQELFARAAAQDEEEAPARKKTKPERETKSIESMQAEWDAAWQIRLDEAVAAAREEGYAQGYAEAEGRLAEQFETTKQELSEDIRRLRVQWDRFIEDSKPLLVELGFEVAQAVLDAPLSSTIKSVSARALTEAVEQLAGSALIEVALHPVDFLRIQESGLVEQLESLHAGIRWEPRSEMKPGDWSVQSPVGAVRRLEAELLSILKSRLGLLAVAEKRSAAEQHNAAAPAAGTSDAAEPNHPA